MSDEKELWIGCYQCGKYQKAADLEVGATRMKCGHGLSESYELPEPPKQPTIRGARYHDRRILGGDS